MDAEQTLLPDSKADALAAGLEQMYYEVLAGVALAGLRAQVVHVKRRRNVSAPPAKRSRHGSRTLMELCPYGGSRGPSLSLIHI